MYRAGVVYLSYTAVGVTVRLLSVAPLASVAGKPLNVTVGPVTEIAPLTDVANVAIPVAVVPRFVILCKGTTKFELV